MSEAIPIDEPIPLSLQLSNEIIDAYVEAELFDENNAALFGTPKELEHQNTGHYLNNDFIMPDVVRVFAIYRVWTDDTKTTRHPQHCEAIEDIFPRELNGGSGDPTSSGGGAICNVQVCVLPEPSVSINVVETENIIVKVSNEPIVQIDIHQNEIVEIQTTQSVVQILVDCG